MKRWLIGRLLGAAGIVFVAVSITFFAMHAAPGTPFLPPADRPLDPAREQRLRQRFGLDQPVAVQYVRYLGALARGDLGESFSQRRPVRAVLADALPWTLLLALAALLIDFLVGLLAGLFQAVRAGRASDRLLTALTLFVYSVPTFWLALLLLLVFGQWLRWLPVGGAVDPVMHATLGPAGKLLDIGRHLLLPALALGLVGAAGTARLQRAALVEALGFDFIRAARARGVTERRILARHALRNALLPWITMLGLALPFLLTGSVVVERVFAWPGMGRLAADAVASRDYPLVLASALVAATLVVLGSLLADLLYAVADPRIRLKETSG